MNSLFGMCSLFIDNCSFLCYNFSMTIEQTVDIPADRRITIEVPREIPAGRTNVIIQFPVSADTRQEETVTKNSPTPISDSLVGILSGVGDIDIDEIRMERLAKHLK
jgi:hypothetical protein